MRPSEENRILLVDDDAAIRRLLTLLFKRQGWTVVAHVDGEHVVDEIAALTPDVLVLDLMLPKVSGFEVIERLQAETPAFLKRIIVLTAVSTSTLRALTCAPALWAVVRKPFDNRDLIATVGECLRAPVSADRWPEADVTARRSESAR